MMDWDQKYATAPDGLFGDGPNEYVREICARSDFDPCTALCLADGDGRNSRWLALQGVEVTAVDLSPVATDLAKQKDMAAGVSVTRVVGDLAAWQPPEQVFDAVFLIYLQCELPIRTRALELGAAALKAGGWFIVEAFAAGQSLIKDVGPKDAAVRYSMEEIERAVPGFQIKEAFTGRALLNEGERHSGLGEIIRFAARKPI